MKPAQIKIVMVGTTHPGNIGAAARAMTNMCFEDLCLVAPQCPVGEVAYARASGAHAVLDQRETHEDLSSAIADCHYVVATSARRRSLPWPELSPFELGEKLCAGDADSRVAVVFGREHSGLTNAEIQLCNHMVCIPSNPNFSSLNIAAAIQVVCYEIYRQLGSRHPPPASVDSQEQAASSAELEGLFEHLQASLLHSGFLDPQQPGLIMQRLRRLYLRSEMTHNEINILRGMLSALDKSQN